MIVKKQKENYLSTAHNMTQWFYYAYAFSRYDLVANNVYIGQHQEMDIFGLRKSGYCDEIEIKTSVSDFKADFKKVIQVKVDPYTPEPEWCPCTYKACQMCHGTGTKDDGTPCGYQRRYGERSWDRMKKHEAIETGMTIPNYFSFMVPEDIADKVEIPDYAGLYVCTVDGGLSNRLTEVKKAPLLHRNKISEKSVNRIARKMALRYWDGKTCQPEYVSEDKSEILEKHQNVGRVLSAALEANHPCMKDWAEVGFKLKYG